MQYTLKLGNMSYSLDNNGWHIAFKFYDMSYYLLIHGTLPSKLDLSNNSALSRR